MKSKPIPTVLVVLDEQGNKGVSMIIVTSSESRKIKTIEKIIQSKIEAKKIPTGIEICETQLYHLAQKIHQTQINDEITPYLPKVEEVLNDLSKEELIQRLVSVEFARFHNYYKNAKDLNISGGDRGEGGRDKVKHNKKDSTRFFINIGARDDYNWMHLKDFLKSTLSLDQEDVFHVDVMDSFSFFNTPNSQRDKVLETFTDFQLNGRYINVEVSEKAPRGGGGGRGKRKKISGGGKRSDHRKFNQNDGGFDQGKKKRRKANREKPSGFGRRSRR